MRSLAKPSAYCHSSYFFQKKNILNLDTIDFHDDMANKRYFIKTLDILELLLSAHKKQLVNSDFKNLISNELTAYVFNYQFPLFFEHQHRNQTHTKKEAG